jgi:hypothetical protein
MDIQMLADLFSGTRFNWDYSTDSIRQMAEMAEANEAEYERLEADDPERLERLKDYMCLLFSAALQKQAIERYGNASDQSVLQVLIHEMNTAEEITKVRKIRDDALAKIEPGSPIREYLRQYMKEAENRVCNVLVELTSRLKLIPETDADSLTTVLFHMWQEGENVNHIGDITK